MADPAPSAPFPASSRTHGAGSWRRGPEPADPREPVRQARQRPRSGGRAQRRRLRSAPDERQEHALPARRGGRDPARGGQARPGDRDSPDRPVRPRAGKVAMGTSETNHSRSQSRTAQTRPWHGKRKLRCSFPKADKYQMTRQSCHRTSLSCSLARICGRLTWTKKSQISCFWLPS